MNSAKSDAGFTLIETLVAFVIVAAAFAVVLGLLSSGMLLTTRATNQRLALLVADSTLARVGSDIPLQVGAASGQTQAGFQWTVSISPYHETGLTDAIAHPYQVTVLVSRGRRGVQLTTLRLDHAGSRP